MKPKDVTKANGAQVLTQYSSKPQPVQKKKFKVNDRVRVSRLRPCETQISIFFKSTFKLFLEKEERQALRTRKHCS